MKALFKSYLQDLKQEISEFEAVRVGVQVFELTAKESAHIYREVSTLAGYGLKCSSLAVQGSLERR